MEEGSGAPKGKKTNQRQMTRADVWETNVCPAMPMSLSDIKSFLWY